MNKKYNSELSRYSKSFEKKAFDNFTNLDSETLEKAWHNMLTEGICLIDESLEKAELCDFFALERMYGRTDKKR